VHPFLIYNDNKRGKTMIKLEALTKYYNKNARGIIDVSVEIKAGEVFGFIGPNGAGKSTTVRTILNLIFPTSGKGEVDGLDIVKDTVEVRKLVGYIPGEIHLYNSMVVDDFIRYSMRFYGDIDEDYYAYLVKKLQLDIERKMDDLSLGNKKKVAIVQAFLSRPKILILDEPTSGLDPLMQNTFFSLLDEERKRGTTIFFSSHILSEVQRICDRVGIIKEGRLIKVESIHEIMKTRAKKVRLVSKDPLPDDRNIINLEKVDGVRYFVYTGPINDLLKIIESLEIEDISINDPSLEEVFMHYYETEDGE
jgi:ABC-2 type transport system ATP-binding protein